MLINRRNYDNKPGQRSRQAGDTLIEVLFAITIFSMVIVVALSLMNQGSSASRRSLEMVLVRDQIDAQAETLRLMHESYVTNHRAGVTYNTTDATTSLAEEYYKVILASTGTSASQFKGLAACPASVPDGGFLVNSRTARLVTGASVGVSGDTYAKVEFNPANDAAMTGQGIWVEGIRSQAGTTPETKNTGYIDFHIRACWDAPGLGVPMSMGTIVRLYEPRS